MPNMNKAYTWAVQTCNAPNVGYSQTYRNQKTIKGITYYDCSSFINYALLAGGFTTPNYAPLKNAFTTTSMISELLKLGFVEVDAQGEYKAGDIGWISGHTEMCYKGGVGSGIFMGAHTSNAPLSGQVSIGSSSGNPEYRRSFSRLFRYGDTDIDVFGSSIYVVSALAGNAWRESHINPTLQQQGGSAFGLFQWDGSRKDNLFKYMEDNGFSRDYPIGQMQYLIVENEWQGEFAGITSLTDFLNSTSQDIAMLTEAFCTCWERPGIPALQERIDFATKAYTFIRENANDLTISKWETEPMYYLSETQALRNAVLMFRFFSAGGGGGGTIGSKKKGMPLWMMCRYF